TTNLLKFKEFTYEEEEDPYIVMMSRLKSQKKSGGDFTLKLRVSTDPKVEAFVELDKSSGNVINGRGTGTIDLEVNTGTGNFDIKGDYTISSGNVHFVVLGLAARDFIINEGSNIRFNGDVMESTLDISATYRTKASLSTLIADTTSINNKRLVECGIRVTDKLKNPRLSFSINIPDLDPMIKAKVENALSTEDKVQKQFIYLLISNSFLPDEQSG
ncbi:MAG: translocation/assembly module TamB, partial [Bacteroidales bacterium]|nr:translocation/assembly module TamB [Bacteroidales bacterium]